MTTMAPRWILLHLLFSLLPLNPLATPRSSPHTLFNYTWIIYNEAGDVANSSSHLGTSPLWQPLQVDLCALALGAADVWGTPNDFLPRSGPANPQIKYIPPLKILMLETPLAAATLQRAVTFTPNLFMSARVPIAAAPYPLNAGTLPTTSARPGAARQQATAPGTRPLPGTTLQSPNPRTLLPAPATPGATLSPFLLPRLEKMNIAGTPTIAGVSVCMYPVLTLVSSFPSSSLKRSLAPPNLLL